MQGCTNGAVGLNNNKTHTNSRKKKGISSWWFQPTRKIWIKLDHFPKFRDENEKIFETTIQLCWENLVFVPLQKYTLTKVTHRIRLQQW